MKRAAIVLITVSTAFLIPSAARAATGAAGSPDGSSTTTTEANLPEIFPWASKPGGFQSNWPEGLANFVLGMAGALVTVYLFLGDFLPSMGGKAEYELMKTELDDLKKRRGRTLVERERFAKGEVELTAERLAAEDSLTEDLDRTIDRLEAQVNRERWRLFLIGFPIYIVLGGFFAAAFALNFLQAVLIGFGWTAVADRIGLQKEIDVKRQLREDQVAKLESQALESARDVARLQEDKRKLEVERDALTVAAARSAFPGT